MEKTIKKRWTDEEKDQLLKETEGTTNLSYVFTSFGSKTNRSPKAVEQQFYKLKKQAAAKPIALEAFMDDYDEVHEEPKKKAKPWTEEEDETLLRYVRAGVSNLSECFVIVGEQIGRSSTAVATHWYSVLSKKPSVKAFGRISDNDVLFNRKNGKGIPCSKTVWQRVLRVITNLLHV